MEPLADGKLNDSGSIPKLIQRMKTERKTFLKKGALIFDVDHTLIPPDKALGEYPRLRSALLRLLRSGTEMALISGSPGAVIRRRIINSLISEGPGFEQLTLYVNGGSCKMSIESLGGLVTDKAFVHDRMIRWAFVLKEKMPVIKTK